MRLIDGDALINALIRKEPFSDCARVVIAECMEEVRHAPTIEERKKGKWIKHRILSKELREWDVCTACGTGCKRREYGTNPDGTEYITEFSYPYCPNCGADMREQS